MSRRAQHGRIALALLAAAAACMRGAAAEPYVDPALLDMPWGKYSFARQAWRGYLETVPAVDYLDGLGVVWGQSPPGEAEDATAEKLAWAGFRRVRIEVPWGAVRADETGFEDGGARLARMLQAAKAHGLRPLILLNANHLHPCPVQWRELRVARGAAAGARSITVSGAVAGIEPRAATLMSLADGVVPGPLVDASTPVRGGHALALSKGLPRAVESGEVLRLAIFKYPPLYPVGTAEFERTAGGWLRYVSLVARFVERHYGGDFDVEIWNEFSFGSGFLSVDNYLAEKSAAGAPEPFHRGGRIWELASRTVQALEREHASVRTIWGFSNTSFYHVKIPELPPGVDGQSYHPYGTGRRCYADVVRGKESLLLDASVPAGCIAQPEGWAQSWYQTESLVRLLAPAARAARPPGSAEFRHFITEHGMKPDELGIRDARAARRAQEKFLLRAPLLWLNKGIAALYVYNAYDAGDLGYGVLDADGGVSAGMRALHELTARLAGAVRIAEPRALSIELGRDGAAGSPRLDELVALLPFQVSERKFALAAYVMTEDFPADLPPQHYTIAITGVRGQGARVTYFSPESRTEEPLTVVSRSNGELAVTVALTDVPRLIEIEEAAAPAGGELR